MVGSPVLAKVDRDLDTWASPVAIIVDLRSREGVRKLLMRQVFRAASRPPPIDSLR